MNSVNMHMELIQLLIDRVQHQQGGAKENKASYDKLLTLSEQFDYAYGQALAHAFLARYFWVVRQDRDYYFHLEKARYIAQGKSYFDVQMTCCRLEGLRHAAECNETTALALYLDGCKIAREINDRMAIAGFCRDIGDIFYSTNAHQEAEQFYREALELLEDYTIQDAQLQRKAVLVGLVLLACIRGDAAQADSYLALCNAIGVTSRELGFMQQQGEAYILLLQGDRARAQEQVSHLVEVMLREEYRSLPESAYFTLMQLLLELGDQAGAALCMGKLEELCKYSGQNTVLRTQRLRLRYAELFNLASDEPYRIFYETTIGSELSRGQSIGQSFNNLIALYETEKKRDLALREQSELEIMVNTDGLTQIYNRRYLSKLISKFSQDERVSSLGFVMVDVDYFKEYNDRFGHPHGDVALAWVAETLARLLPKHAYAVRYGGDEFVCLFVDSSQAEIEAFVKAVQTTLQATTMPHSSGSVSKAPTLSFGIYNEPHPLGVSEELLALRADEALYNAKAQGRNTYAIYNTQREDM